MSSELDDNPSRWDEPVDRRTALAAAGGVGAALALGGLAGADRAASPVYAQNAGKVTAYFGQFGTIAEQEGFAGTCSGASRGDVDSIFVPITAPTLFVDRVRAEAQAGKGNIDLLIGLHGAMATLEGQPSPRHQRHGQPGEPAARPRQAREARHANPVPPPGAGDLRHGRQQGRAQSRTQGSEH